MATIIKDEFRLVSLIFEYGGSDNTIKKVVANIYYVLKDESTGEVLARNTVAHDVINWLNPGQQQSLHALLSALNIRALEV